MSFKSNFLTFSPERRKKPLERREEIVPRLSSEEIDKLNGNKTPGCPAHLSVLPDLVVLSLDTEGESVPQ